MAGNWSTTWDTKPNSDEAIVQEAQDFYKYAYDWEAEARTRFDYDYKFSNGDTHNKFQWDSTLVDSRELLDKPVLTINKTQQHNLMIINDAKQNKPGVRIRPVGEEASFEAAQIFQELVYHIEYISGAENIYDSAVSWQVQAGIGYWRINTDYINDKSFDQEIYIKHIKDPRSVYMDPDISEIDGSDAKKAIIFEDVKQDTFKAENPGVEVGPTTLGNNSTGWITKDHIRIAEYYRKVIKKDKLVTFTTEADGTIIKKLSELGDLEKLIYNEIRKGSDVVKATYNFKERSVLSEQIEWYKIAGDKIIERSLWLGKYIPIVRIPGIETVIDGILDRKGHTRALINAQQMYNYNCLDLNTVLPTPTGWTTIKDVKEGDWLIDDKGKPTKVLGISPININRKCFEITFDTGQKIVADETHLWTVEERGKRTSKTWDWSIKTINTSQLISKKHFIKVVEPVELADIKLPIHPYVLGAWLGDGSTSVNAITSSLVDMNEMKSNLSNCGYEIGSPRVYSDKTAGIITIHGLRNDLSITGLLGNKHIPSIYLRSSRKQREELLQGLMDTDGCISKYNRQCIFVNTDLKLINGIIELLSSLGIKCTKEIVPATLRKFPGGYTSECLEAYRISFTADPDKPVFKLNRKLAIQKTFKSLHWRRTKRHGIVSIVEVPSVPVKCLTVDAPSKLFLAGHSWIPTHNTSANIEFGALQTKAPWLAPSAAIENFEEYYETANDTNHSYLPYNHIDEDGNEIPPPSRPAAPQSSPSYIEGLKIAQNEMMMASGQYQAQLGENENAKSGIAINARQRQGDRATYHFLDNQAIGIRFTGKIIIDLIPKIYDTKRVRKIQAIDGSIMNVTIDPQADQAHQKIVNPQDRENDQQVKNIIFNPNVGMYDIQSDPGPSFATRRQEAYNALTQIAVGDKQFMGIAGDLLWKVADFPEADVLAQRYRKVIPPNILGDTPDPQTEEMMHKASDKIIQLQDLIKQMTEELKNKQGELEIKTREMTLREKEVSVEQQRLDYDAETKRLTALGNSGPGLSVEQIQPVVRELLQGMIQNGELSINALPGPHEGGMVPGQEDQLGSEPANPEPPEGEQGDNGAPPVEGAKKAPDGNWYIKHNDGYARVELQ